MCASAPQFKLYIFNGEEVFFGFYPSTEFTAQIDGELHVIYDLMGKDAVMFQHADTGNAESTQSQYVAEARHWFDSMWNTIAKDFSA